MGGISTPALGRNPNSARENCGHSAGFVLVDLIQAANCRAGKTGMVAGSVLFSSFFFLCAVTCPGCFSCSIQGASLCHRSFSLIDRLILETDEYIPKTTITTPTPYYTLPHYSNRQPPLVRFWKNPSGSYRNRVSSAYCLDALLIRPQ